MIFQSRRPILMAIVDAAAAACVPEILEGGVDLIQVRARDLDSARLADLVRSVARDAGPDRVIVNSRPDLVELTVTLGVQLPERGLPPAVVRRHFPGLLVGASRHDRAGLLKAQEEGADFAIVGPVFKTPGKEARAMGIASFTECIAGVSMPVIAVGGVTPEEIPAVLRAGAAGIAAIRPFAEPRQARRNAAELRAALDAVANV